MVQDLLKSTLKAQAQTSTQRPWFSVVITQLPDVEQIHPGQDKSIVSSIPPPSVPPLPVFNLLDSKDWIPIQHGSQWENSMNKTELGRMSYDK